MRNKWILLIYFLTVNLGFSELLISKTAIRGNNFYLSVKTLPKGDFNPFSLLENGNTLWVGYDIRVFKRGLFPELDLFLTNISIRYRIQKDYLNEGYVASVWYSQEFAYKRWIENDEKLLRFLYRLENFRAFSFTDAKENDFFYLEISQFFDMTSHFPNDDDIVGKFFRFLIGTRYEISPVRSKIFNKDGIFK